MKRYISIDIGGTAIKYGIIGEDAKIMLKKSMPTEAGKGGPAILDKVIGIVNEMLVSHSEIAGICISTAGMVDTETGSSALKTLADDTTTEWKRASEAVGMDYSSLEFPNWDVTKDYTDADYAALK